MRLLGEWIRLSHPDGGQVAVKVPMDRSLLEPIIRVLANMGYRLP